jgi:protein ImuA
MSGYAAAPKEGPRAAVLAELRRRVRAIEGGGAAGTAVLPLDAAPIDAALAGGLAPGALHELGGGQAQDGAATHFAALLAGRAASAGRRPVLWIAGEGDLYAPGLAACGLPPERLLLAHARRRADALWAMEEAARSGALAAVVGEVEGADLTAGRRLQLAAEAGGTLTILLVRRSGAGLATPSAATTRWRVAAAPGGLAPGAPGVGEARWRLELLRCRGGRPGSWLVAAAGGRVEVVEPAAPERRGGAPALLPVRPTGAERAA